MTVIACKNGYVAADSSSWQGDLKIGEAAKLHRLSDGSIFAASGWKPIILEAKAWLELAIAAEPGLPPPKPEWRGEKGDLDGLILRPNRSITMIFDRFEMWQADNQDMGHVGSHYEFVWGAMLAGAAAGEAVALAIRHCRFASGEVRQMRLE